MWPKDRKACHRWLAVPKLESHSTRKTSSGSRPSRWRPRYKSFEPSNTGPAIFCFSLVQGLRVIRCRPVRVFVFSFNIPPRGLSAHGQHRLSFFRNKSSQQQAGLARNQSIIHIPNQTKQSDENRRSKFLILVSGSEETGALVFLRHNNPELARRACLA